VGGHKRRIVQRVVNGVRARSRLQQVNTGLNAQLQQARLKCGNEVEGGTSEASCNDHCAKTKGRRSAYRSVLALVHDGAVPLDGMCA
jgi:hypothetical protein